jgi:hypothetical protein
MPIDPTEAQERLARIVQMIEEYRWADERRRLKRALRLWRKGEAQQQLVELEAEPERVH